MRSQFSFAAFLIVFSLVGISALRNGSSLNIRPRAMKPHIGTIKRWSSEKEWKRSLHGLREKERKSLNEPGVESGILVLANKTEVLYDRP